MTARGRGPLLLAALAACVGVAALAHVVVADPARSGRAHRPVGISGDASRLIFPGSSQRLDLRLRNRRGVPLLVTRLRVRVSVDRAHRQAGCSRRDYVVRQMRRNAFPIRLAPHAVRLLSRLPVRAYPQLGMVDSPLRNQDACKGARLRLRYRAKVR